MPLTIESKQRICHMIILKEIKKLYKELNSIESNMTTEYNKYHTSRLYKITTRKYPNLQYIGSTYMTVEKRLKHHVAKYKAYLNGKQNYVSSFDILQHGDYEITVIREVFCNNDIELRQAEQAMIDSIGADNVVNKNKAYSELKGAEYQTQYQKQYRRNNEEYWKQYQQNNAIKLKEKHNCECGGKYTTRDKSKHFKGPKHQKYINSQ